MMKKLQRGFTLIELLVVIAIIGILAAVVLGSLNDARSGGQSASIKQSIANIRAQAELVYNATNYSYDTVCTDPKVTTLVGAALNVINGTAYAAGTHGVLAYDATVGAAAANTAACHDSINAYAVTSPLADGVTFWCVDSSGFSGEATDNDNDYICE